MTTPDKPDSTEKQRTRDPHPLATVERERAAEALRRLIESFVAHEPGEDALAAVADWAEATTAAWSTTAPRPHALLRLHELLANAQDLGDRKAVDALCDRAVVGSANPGSYDIWIGRDGEQVVAEATLGLIAGGAPGRAHGGVVASIFDDVTGHVAPIYGLPAFTGELSVRYSLPVPLHTPIEFRAWLTGRSPSGRRLFVEGSASADGAVVATCHATFVVVDFEKFRPGTPESQGAI